MLNPFIKNISGCGLASFRQEFYLYDSQKAEQHASFLDLLFYLKRRSHTRALQLQAPVAHHRKGQLCTAERAISLLDTTSHVLLENASVLWLQTKRNKSYLFQGPLIKHEMLNCFFLLSALDPQRSPSFVCASTSDHDLLSFYYLFEVSPFQKN